MENLEAIGIRFKFGAADQFAWRSEMRAVMSEVQGKAAYLKSLSKDEALFYNHRVDEIFTEVILNDERNGWDDPII